MAFTTTEQGYDCESERKAFDDTKTGVKGLVDAKVSKVPRIFHHPPHGLQNEYNDTQFSIPTIDLQGVESNATERKAIVDKVGAASETFGFFQIINHGIPTSVLEEILKGLRRFHEQDTEEKKKWYRRQGKVQYNNYGLYTRPYADWRDTLALAMAPNPPEFEDLPPICRDIVVEYSEQVQKLGILLFELLSEALGLGSSHLKDMDCDKGFIVMGHYYPACPEPELTMGSTQHADHDFVTVLLQDTVGGLEVLIRNRWICVPHVPGALIINIGDLIQLVTNDKFKSVDHRVLSNKTGPRLSVACFFTALALANSKVPYGPIKELLSKDNPPKYKDTTVEEFISYGIEKGANFALSDFKLSTQK